MTSHDGAGLSPATRDALTGFWRRILHTESGEVTRSELREVARRVATGAHEARLHPEDVIIEIKQSWLGHHDAANRQPLEGRLRMQTVVTDLISLCIQEFYRVPAGSDPARAPRGYRIHSAEGREENR